MKTMEMSLATNEKKMWLPFGPTAIAALAVAFRFSEAFLFAFPVITNEAGVTVA